jgi:hypothetical protein
MTGKIIRIRQRINFINMKVWIVELIQAMDNTISERCEISFTTTLPKFKDAINFTRIWIKQNQQPDQILVLSEVDNDTGDLQFHYIHDITDDAEIAVLLLSIKLST